MEVKERQRAKRLMSLSTFMSMKFDRVDFTGEWKDLIGCPVLSGMWIMWGKSSNGKTTAAIKLLRYLTGFEKCLFWSKEEGVSDSLQNAMSREMWQPKEKKKVFLPPNDWALEDLKTQLRSPKSPKIIFIDSLQVFGKLYGSQFYLDLKEEFGDKKLFIFVSQAEGQEPKGAIGDDVKYLSNVKMYIEGGRLSAQSRLKGSVIGAYIIVIDALYRQYWSPKNKKKEVDNENE
jgi:hypothetical protein